MSIFIIMLLGFLILVILKFTTDTNRYYKENVAAFGGMNLKHHELISYFTYKGGFVVNVGRSIVDVQALAPNQYKLRLFENTSGYLHAELEIFKNGLKTEIHKFSFPPNYDAFEASERILYMIDK